MKIAFVNQPIDTITPPYQTSVGACTYGAACSLSRNCEVLVYGLVDRNEDFVRDQASDRVDFRFLPSTASDRRRAKACNLYSHLIQTSQPVSSSSLWYPQFGRQVAEALQKEACDVIHVQHCSQYVPIIRELNPGAKIVLHLHAEWFSQTNPATIEERIRGVDLLTAVSDYITEKTKRDFPRFADRCQTTYNGIDSDEFAREKDYGSLNRRIEKRIFYSGAVSPHKGLHVVLDAFKLVVKQYPNVRLDIAGPHCSYPIAETFDRRDRALIETVAHFYPENRASSLLVGPLARSGSKSVSYLLQLREKIGSDLAGKVKFIGMIPRPELVDRYYDADVFVFPPVWDEGFGIPPVEAMAAGTPVVASRSGAIIETVTDQQTGFLVAKNDPQALAQRILNLLEDDRLRVTMGRAARGRALQHFTWNRVADRMLERYQALVGSHPEIKHLSVPSAVPAGLQSSFPSVVGHSIK